MRSEEEIRSRIKYWEELKEMYYRQRSDLANICRVVLGELHWVLSEE
jgi:hypothetical protein